MKFDGGENFLYSGLQIIYFEKRNHTQLQLIYLNFLPKICICKLTNEHNKIQLQND
jgi:hypothetical protein